MQEALTYSHGPAKDTLEVDIRDYSSGLIPTRAAR